MKKLMIMLAAVAMAAGVQAAALSWTTWAFTNDGSQIPIGSLAARHTW